MSIEAMKLALEALQDYVDEYGSDDSGAQYVLRVVKEALAQPEQEQGEPVAMVTGVYGGRFIVEPTNSAMVLPVNMALYAHPQPRKPLTHAQMKKIWYAMQNIMGWYSFQEIARAIEAAHGIKE